MNNLAHLEENEKYLRKIWSEVKEDPWGDLKNEAKRALKRLMETSMAIEVQDLIGSMPWAHDKFRKNYRNGYYYRSLLTSSGLIDDLRIPRIRKGLIQFKTLQRYKQRSKDIDDMVCQMFLNGISTRDVKRVLEPIVGVGAISSTTVSNITKSLSSMVFKFHNRSLSEDYSYLILDGIYLNAKSPLFKKKRCILACYGIKVDGKRELIDFFLASQGESEDAWVHFLNILYHRGLTGKFLKLVGIDGNKGLYNAVRLIYPTALVQRCWAHKLRNLSNKCSKSIRDEIIRGARKIYNAGSRSDAIAKFKEWSKIWRSIAPKAVKCLEEDIEELLNFYYLPESYWIKLRTTNIIERAFREVRKRTRPMSCFQNRESLERIIYAIFTKLNKSWNE